jgi:hypothetical protein
VRFFGSSNPPLKVERAASRLNIEGDRPERNRGQISQGIWQRESAKDFTAGIEQCSALTVEADRKLNLIKDLQD